MNAKPVAALLTAVVCLQVYGLLRLKDIDNEMESLRRAQENQAYGVERQLEAMWSQLSDLADSKRWSRARRAPPGRWHPGTGCRRQAPAAETLWWAEPWPDLSYPQYL